MNYLVMNDRDITAAIQEIIDDLEKWSKMARERAQKKIAEEREKKLNKVIKKRWIWW